MDFKQIAQRVSILDAASFLNLEVKQNRSPCPACNRGGDRALQFFTDTNKFKCWAYEGKMWGDSVQLVAHVQGIEMPASARSLAKHFGLDKPGEGKGFDVAKYRGSLAVEHELLAGIPPELCRETGIGVALKGAHQGKIAVPLYDSQGRFLVYASADGLKLPKNWTAPRT